MGSATSPKADKFVIRLIKKFFFVIKNGNLFKCQKADIR